MLDLLLIAMVGFLGSFGHCVGMCGPIAVAFSLSRPHKTPPPWQQQLYFHGLLNLGRIFSYTLVGAGIGALGEVILAGSQLAGVGSGLRRFIALFIGVLLVWFGLVQIKPAWLPQVPVFNPFAQTAWHERLNRAMRHLSGRPSFWTPLFLGFVWGFIPCGFLYAAQLKAVETGSLWQGAATMLAFGVGTVPSLLAVGIFAAKLSVGRRSQLFRLGGWVTLTIGLLTLLRSDAMVDYTGYGALILLILALVARPVSRVWPALLRYRRAFGVGAFILAVAHTLYMMQNTLKWNIEALSFMLPQYQGGIWAGIIALGLMLPLALTSFDGAMSYLGKRWRQIHLLSVPVLIFAGVHTILVGSRFLGGLQWTTGNWVRVTLLGATILAVFLVRWRLIWSLLSLDRFYTSPKQNGSQ
jgi:sulfite exporter TauE/SafE